MDVFDEEYELVAGGYIQEKSLASTSEEIRRGTKINQWDFSLEAGHHNVFLSLEDSAGKRFGVISTDFTVESFSHSPF